MKATELREKSIDELKAELIELRKEQFNLRMQEAQGQLGQVHQHQAVRRNIARVKTVLQEKRTAGES